jgi:hypothetical protein
MGVKKTDIKRVAAPYPWQCSFGEGTYFFCNDLGQKLGMKPVIAF